MLAPFSGRRLHLDRQRSLNSLCRLRISSWLTVLGIELSSLLAPCWACQQFIELDLDGQRLLVLRTLNQEHHLIRDDRRPGLVMTLIRCGLAGQKIGLLAA